MPNIDLHMHSCFSDDGEYTVPELLQRCKNVSLSYAAIADHNSVRAVPELLALAPAFGVHAVSGVELDCVHEGRNFHLLGYHFDHTQPVFAEIEQNIIDQEARAAARKIALIREETGIPLQDADVFAAANGGVVTGELIAELLLSRADAASHAVLAPYLPGGGRSDNPYVNFYWDYFSQGKPAYVPIQYITLAEGVSLLHAAGGIAVLAHPGQNLKGDNDFLKKIIPTGIDGVEAYSSYHSAEEAAFFAAAARENNLLVTCGSDFHGKIKPAISLCGHGAGEEMPAILAALQAAGVF